MKNDIIIDKFCERTHSNVKMTNEATGIDLIKRMSIAIISLKKTVTLEHKASKIPITTASKKPNAILATE